MSDPRKPSPTRRKGAAFAAVLIVIALIALLFIGQNASHLKDKTNERQVSQPDGGVQQVTQQQGR